MAKLQGILKSAPKKREETGLNDPQALFVKKNGDSDNRVAILIENADIIDKSDATLGEVEITLPDNSTVYVKKPMGFDDYFASTVLLNLNDASLTYTPTGHSTY